MLELKLEKINYFLTVSDVWVWIQIWKIVRKFYLDKFWIDNLDFRIIVKPCCEFHNIDITSKIFLELFNTAGYINASFNEYSFAAMNVCFNMLSKLNSKR